MSVSIQADEHVKKVISDGVKKQGIDLYTVKDEGIKGISDKDILKLAREKDRVILTNNSDFLDFEKHPGILFIKSQYDSVGDIIREIVRKVDRHEKEEFHNTIFYIP